MSYWKTGKVNIGMATKKDGEPTLIMLFVNRAQYIRDLMEYCQSAELVLEYLTSTVNQYHWLTPYVSEDIERFRNEAEKCQEAQYEVYKRRQEEEKEARKEREMYKNTRHACKYCEFNSGWDENHVCCNLLSCAWS